MEYSVQHYEGLLGAPYQAFVEYRTISKPRGIVSLPAASAMTTKLGYRGVCPGHELRGQRRRIAKKVAVSTKLLKFCPVA